MDKIREENKEVLSDLYKIYVSAIESYNPKIHQTINDKYTTIDKNMFAIYVYVKILEARKDKSKEAYEVLYNYMLKQLIYSETGNLSLEFTEKEKASYYIGILDKIILEKFEYKNRLLKELKYNYKIIEANQYSDLLTFCEKIGEYSILNKILNSGNKEAKEFLNKILEDLNEIENCIEVDEVFAKEKLELIDLVRNNKLENSDYGKILGVVFNLRDVYRYSTIPLTVQENDLFHLYTIAVVSSMYAYYLIEKYDEKIDIREIILKSLFHDFGEFKGNEIVTQFKNYNEDTIKMFKEIEEADEKELEAKVGEDIYNIIKTCKKGPEGYIYEMIDKMLGIMKLTIEVDFFGNNINIKAIVSVFQSRFKRFLKVYQIEELKQKELYLDLILHCYIYVKERLMKANEYCYYNYFTKEDFKKDMEEIEKLKADKSLFLKD